MWAVSAGWRIVIADSYSARNKYGKEIVYQSSSRGKYKRSLQDVKIVLSI